MSFIAWIIIGAVAGWLASMIMGTDASMGAVANIIVGMIGSLIGGGLVALLSRGDQSIFDYTRNLSLSNLIVSVVGAVVLIWLTRLFRRQAA
jgi:uncharacterized membrane protein YeaQ/YmgE (transglycosylase-associated protein family)